MFLHIQAFDKQISLHSMEEVKADPENDIKAQSADPLSEVIASALKFYTRKEKDIVVFNEEGKKLDLSKSAAANGLKENSLVKVTSQKLLDEEAKRVEEQKQADIERAKQEKKNAAKTSSRNRVRKTNPDES